MKTRIEWLGLALCYALFCPYGLIGREIQWEELQSAQRTIEDSPRYSRGYPKIIDETDRKIPKLHRLVVNTSPLDLDCCIIAYTSYSKVYERLLKDLLKKLPKYFKGHILYRIGGWPNMEEGFFFHIDYERKLGKRNSPLP